jgi:hypothetical protein
MTIVKGLFFGFENQAVHFAIVIRAQAGRKLFQVRKGDYPISLLSNGASEGTRTPDRRFTKPMLYQLSYAGSIRTTA